METPLWNTSNDFITLVGSGPRPEMSWTPAQVFPRAMQCVCRALFNSKIHQTFEFCLFIVCIFY